MSEKEGKSIPTSKVARASKIVGASVKVGGNYLKHYGKKAINMKTTQEDLDEANAETIYDALSNLKGSALKAAQMMSMDTQTLPKAFQDKFAMAQYNAPPLSAPLIVNTFKKQFGQSPTQVYDEFDPKASYAASIGQVHKAKLKNKALAVKIQYPGVADSVKSDLRMIKPLALRFLKLKEKDVKEYFEEVESKLLEETDYELEVKNGMEITKASSDLKGLVFPKYYPELSSKKIITMDWIEGLPLKEFAAENTDKALANQLGQAIWDFYNHQIFNLQVVHADPHPGNFLVTEKDKVAVLDFGCVKEIPADFFRSFIKLLDIDLEKEQETLASILIDLDMLLEEDTEENKKYLLETFSHLLGILSLPYKSPSFDFGDDDYFQKLYQLGEEVSKDVNKNKDLKSARGSRHFLYLNRTFFGLFSILNMLKATVNTVQEDVELINE